MALINVSETALNSGFYVLQYVYEHAGIQQDSVEWND
jgi:hypothetical protein